MSTIINEPNITMPLIRAIRELLEHRALWMYLLCDEARKKGLDPEQFAPQAIRRCGLYQGKGHVQKGGSSSLKSLKKGLFSLPARMVFEMKIRSCTDDHLDIDFHYCPLVASWQKQGCSDEEIARLCDFAMEGDRGIAESFGCELELPKTIAGGQGICEIRFKRKL
ncbi:L-2-amino-thiazoline-4-carboxylic acid hydrolase [Treponema sp. TIM-1]|uniref:L-2-amino-thiazoline-4-carboxylic acid hydrolase n=1 Tax=Treponema sp. TIM-1 TaxID=2898417 RepID=UPI00397EF4C7